MFSSCDRTRKSEKNISNFKIKKHVPNKNQGVDTILLVTMDFKEVHLLYPIIKKIQDFYQLPVKHISVPLPSFAYFKPRNRYRANSIIDYLSALNNAKYRFVAGLTSKDISTINGSGSDWGVFGLGALSSKGCITSSFRLKRKASVALLTERIEKVILHEIGHNKGLIHCKSPHPCFMKAAEGKISNLDTEPMDICNMCKQKLN